MEQKVAVQLNIQEVLLVLNERTEQVNLLRKYNEDLLNDLNAARVRSVDLLCQINDLKKEVEELKKRPSGTNLEDLIWNKIGFIKWCRERDPGLGLKEAKDFVETFWENYAAWVVLSWDQKQQRGSYFPNYFQNKTTYYWGYYFVEDAYKAAVTEKKFAKQ